MASSGDRVILEGEFFSLSKKKGVHRVTLTRSALFFNLISNNSTSYEEEFVQISDIVGCHSLENVGSSESYNSSAHVCDENEKTSPASSNLHYQNGEVAPTQKRYYPRAQDASVCGFIVFSYPFKKKLFSNKKVRTRTVLAFEVLTSSISIFEEKRKLAETWRNVINCLCRDLPVNLNDIPKCVPPPRGRMLLLINPFSGPGKAYTIFKKEIAPILYEACIPYKAVLTEHAGHAGELMKTLKLSDWYGVVIVSGDGLIFETVNGIMQRDDWASSIKFPIGCLPGGSGNALCCSINYAAGEPLDTSMILHSTFILVKHQVLPMDLVVIHIPGRTIFSFLSVTWGIVADIDYESEKYRKLGEARFTIGAIKRIVGLRSYKGRMSFLPVAEYTPKVNASSGKVLSKIRRVLLHSRNSSKLTLNSRDSNSSEISIGKGISENHQCLRVNNAGDAVNLKNDFGDQFQWNISLKDDGFVRNAGELNKGDYADSLAHDKKDDVFSVKIDYGACDDMQGTGDAKVDNHIFQMTNEITKPNSALQENLSKSQQVLTHVESVVTNSNLAENVVQDGHNQNSLSKDETNNSEAHSIKCPLAKGCNVENNQNMTILSDAQEVKVELETYHVKKSDNSPVPAPLLPPLDQEVPSNWVTIEDKFVSVIAIYQTHLGSDLFAAPDAHLCDGHIHLIFIREGISRNALLNLFINFDQGVHIHSPYVEVVKVLAFRLEPELDSGNIMIDGERFVPTPIQGQILPGLARIMAIK